MTYAEKLKHPLWQRKRLEILQRDDFKCCLCGDDQTTLHIHHNTYKGDPWEVDCEHLKTLCAHCHEIVETLKKEGIVDVVIESAIDLSNNSKVIIAVYYSKQLNQKCAKLYQVDETGINEHIVLRESTIDLLKSLMVK